MSRTISPFPNQLAAPALPWSAHIVRALRRGLRRHGVSYLFLAPFLILFSVFVIAPVLTAIYLSFTYFDLLEPARWIGWTNYRELFLDDDVFILALCNTLVFAVITGPLGYSVSFTLAWLINRLRWRTVFALCFYAPSITSAIAMAVIWRYVFAGDRYGFLNTTLMQLGILQEPFLWLQDVRSIMPVIMFVSLWMSMGTGFLVFLAGLQQVPHELYEAGKMDGISSGLQEVLLITLPLMKPQLLFGAVTAITSSFAVFQIAVQLAGLPSPLYAGHTIVAHLYDYAFIRFEMGYAAAIAVLLFGVTFFLGQVSMSVLSSKNE